MASTGQKTNYELGRFRTPSREFPRGQWCVYVKREGEERQRYRLAISLDEPRAKAEAAMNEWIRRRERALFDEGSQTIGDIMERYFANRLADCKSVEKEQRLWRAKMAPFFADRKPQDLVMPMMVEGEERTICHRYAKDRQTMGIRRRTIYHELNILRTGMNWGAKQSLIDPVKVWLPRRGKHRNTKLTAEQLKRFLDECKSPHLHLFAQIAIYTGQRKSAILELTWDKVDLVRRVIDFRVDDDQDDILDSGGMKGRAVVDIGDVLLAELQHARRWRTTNYVIEFNGRPVKDVHKALKRALVRAGIEGQFFGAHAVRHSSATLIADEGHDLRRVQRLLGHEDFGTTDRIYAAHSRGYLAPVVSALENKLQSEPEGDDQGDIIDVDFASAKGASGSTNLRPDGKIDEKGR
jgi:integrase